MSDYQGNIIIKNPAVPTGPATTGRAPGMWKLSEVAYWIKQGVWPNPAIVPDQYFPYVSLLLSTTSLNNANNNLFVDSSGVFNPVSRGGNTAQGSFTPYAANWSNFFGVNTFIRAGSSANLTLGAGSFTCECWVYPTSFTATYAALWDFRNGPNFQAAAPLIWIGTDGKVNYQNGAIASSSSLALNAWTHVAVVRSGTTVTMYFNGVSVGSTTDSTTMTNTYCAVGATNDVPGSYYVSGYISNSRVVIGSAVYTASFTPPTAPLTAITGTALLTCQSNRFRDASTNNFTMAVNGSPSVQDFSPFSSSTYTGITYNQSDITNWSGYFDGSGDYVDFPSTSGLSGSGSFTIQTFIYPTTVAGDCCIYETRGGTGWVWFINSGGYLQVFDSVAGLQTASTTVLVANQWTHVALVKNGSTCTYYVNGASAGTFTLSSFAAASRVRIGARNDTAATYVGYISNLRTDTAALTITVPTSNLSAVGTTTLLTCQSAAFTDNSTNSAIATINGNTTVTGNSPFNPTGFWSNYFDGTGDEVLAPNTPANFGSSNFTAECWVMFTSNTAGYQSVMGNQGTGDGQGWIVYTETNNQLTFAYSTTNSGWAGSISTGITPSVNVWTHLAIVRNGTAITFYVNGTAYGTPISTSSAIASPTGNFRIGRYPYFPGGARTINAYISNVRLVNGTAVYTSNFTPSTTPLTAITNTSLLTCQSSRFADTSANAYTITIGGNPSVQSFDPFYTSTIASNGGSTYFSSTNTGALETILNVPASNAIDIGAGDFTAECWVYLTSAQNYSRIIQFNNTWNSAGAVALLYTNTDTQKFAIAAYDFGVILISSDSTYSLNTWYHLAVTRVGNVFSMYVNGVKQSGTYSTASRLWATTTPFMSLGNGPTSAGGFSPMQGYITDARIIKGTAIYTASFTPPTAPLAPTPSTVLLVNGMNAGVYDATGINDMETAGNAQVRFPSPFAPANYWAGAFDGSGDYLTVSPTALSTGDFTFECWIYPTATGQYQYFYDTRTSVNDAAGFCVIYNHASYPNQISIYSNGFIGTPTITVSVNTWTHFALVRSGGSWRTFVNGVADISPTSVSRTLSNTALKIGAGQALDYFFVGSLSNYRIVNGTAVYTAAFTPPTSPLTAISGTSLLTCQNKTFIDNSSNAFTITAFGNATAGAFGPFTATGGTSVYFNGTTSNRIKPPASPNFAFGTGNFTVEAWVYVTNMTTENFVFDTRSSVSTAGMGFSLEPNTGKLRYSGNANNVLTSTAVTANTWTHVAWVRNGSTLTGYINGVAGGSATNTDNLTQTNGEVGNVPFSAVGTNMYIDEVRVTRGVARYTSNFTPPTQPFPIY